MTYEKSLFSSYAAGYHSPVRLGNRNTAAVAGSGRINLRITGNARVRKCSLNNALHVPSVEYQLLSVLSLDKSGCETLFASGRAFIRSQDVLLASATLQRNLYHLDTLPNMTAFVSVQMDL